MSNDPYVAPSADLQTDAAPIKTSIWSAKGRLGRLSYLAQYLLLTLVFFVVLFGIVAIAMATGNIDGGIDTFEPNSIFSSILPLLVLPLIILAGYLSFCLIIKRLHDRNHVGWLSLLTLIPVINVLVAIYITCFPGQTHPNRYGGQRPTKGWEKVVGIIFIVLMVAAIVGGIASIVLSS